MPYRYIAGRRENNVSVAGEMSARGIPIPPLSSMVHLRSYEDVEEAFRSPVLKQAGHQAITLPISSGTLSTLDGSDHSQRRRFESALVHSDALRYYHDQILVPSLNERIERLFENGHGEVQVDLVDLAWKTFLHVAAALVGLPCCRSLQAIDNLSSLAQALARGNNADWLLDDSAESAMAEALIAKELFANAFFWPAYSQIRAAESTRSKADRPVENRTGLIGLAVQAGFLDAGWDEDLLVREAILYLVGASSAQVRITPHVVSELHNWLAANPDDFSRIDDPEFLRNACLESLRLHPRGSLTIRRATSDVTLRSGTIISEGSFVFLDTESACRDQSIFGSDSGHFNPHRNLINHRLYGLAFGSGPHVCVGLRLTVGSESSHQHNLGSLVRFIRRMMSLGVRPDDSRVPRPIRSGMGEVNFAEYPVVLTRP
jgi:cytochrome P450